MMLVMVTLLALATGSFINVVVYRLPRHIAGGGHIHFPAGSLLLLHTL